MSKADPGLLSQVSNVREFTDSDLGKLNRLIQDPDWIIISITPLAPEYQSEGYATAFHVGYIGEN